jgi:hypothetical protein
MRRQPQVRQLTGPYGSGAGVKEERVSSMVRD